MNHAMIRPFANLVKALVTQLFLGFGLLLLHLPARADDKLKGDTMAGILEAAQAATSAEVFIVPDALVTIIPITQEQVPKLGCRYQVDQNGMLQLLAIINKADFTVGEPFKHKPDLRFLIRLSRNGGAPATLTFTKRPWPNEARLYGAVNGMSATASTQFPEKLLSWASRFTPTPPDKITICP